MGAVNLTKSRSVLDLDPLREGRAPTFRHLDDSSRSNVVSIDPELWDDMGCPEQITVTIEPGDHLNNETIDVTNVDDAEPKTIAGSAQVDVSAVAVDAAKTALVHEAQALGIAVDARWGVKRLTEAIAAASKANEGGGDG